MAEAANSPDADRPKSEGSPSNSSNDGVIVVDVNPQGDIVLDTTFETSPDTLRKSRKAALAASRRAGPSTRKDTTPPQGFKPTVKVAYRVSLEVLKTHSKYFSSLLSNTQFSEARLIASGHNDLRARGISPSDANAEDLPWVSITDDDEATKAVGREHVFEDMLRIIHQLPPKITRVDMTYVTTLAVTADRFDTVAAISHCLNNELKFKFPVTSNRPLRDDTGRPTDVERVLRQKILVSWLLGQSRQLHLASRELILRGSSHWSTFHDSDADMTAAWWTLPDGLEHEMQYRRECIINTIASIQRHFLEKYSSRERQCQLGYDSSAACDSFQLGQMIKFLQSKELLFLVDFSPPSIEAVPDTSGLDLDQLITTLKQCPSYQVDKNHTNCGLRIRIDPILDYIRAMLSASVVAIPLVNWRTNRSDVSWVVSTAGERMTDAQARSFAFTRSLANDSRVRLEGAIYANRMAKQLFTSEVWDWTPEI